MSGMSSMAVVLNGGVEDVTRDGSSGDFIIEVIEMDYKAWDGNGGHPHLQTVLFKVSRQVMTQNPCSDQFKGRFTNPNSNRTSIDKDTVVGVRLWLRIIHGTITPDLYQLSVEDLWNALGFGQRWEFHLEKMQGWYDTWFGQSFGSGHSLDYDDLREHLFPSYALNRYRQFAMVTRKLSYLGRGHIEEHNPTHYRHLHVPARVIDQINAAKGSMRSRLNEALLDCARPKTFCPQQCSKNAESLRTYLDGVSATRIWPFSTQHRVAIQTIIDSPGLVNWTYTKVIGACITCERHLRGHHVTKAKERIEDYWNGLSLDCMNNSKTKTGSIHEDYWLHNSLHQWSKGCRLAGHSRNTWYHSFMGRHEVMEDYLEKQRNRENNNQQSSHSNGDS
ncbi:hypothetical protein BKA61DRAFT_671250 [Leptodontidium sp. MPI-SDFR-AT-0119]|nr:hypothetical protein BKA61DRAFT_671250 [Leptodontidium sp. MPI-SDFR-AT-0119]